MTEDYTLGEYNGVLVVVWRGQPTRDAWRDRDVHLRNLTQRMPGRCALVEVIEKSSPPPPHDIRQSAVEVFREVKDTVACVAFLMDNTELRTTFNRAVLLGMTFLMPQPRPSKVFKSALATADWLAQNFVPT